MSSNKFPEFFWKIPDFLNRKEKFKEYIVSPEFTIIENNINFVKVHVQLYPKGDDTSGYVSLYLRSFEDEVNRSVNISFGILDKENKNVNEKSLSAWYALIAIKALEKNQNNLLSDGTLTIVLKVGKPGMLLMNFKIVRNSQA